MPDEPRAARPLARHEAEREQRGEHRHARLHDAGDARVDVLLAPGDQRERQRGAEQPEHEPRLARRRRARAAAACAAARHAR